MIRASIRRMLEITLVVPRNDGGTTTVWVALLSMGIGEQGGEILCFSGMLAPDHNNPRTLFLICQGLVIFLLAQSSRVPFYQS